MGADRFESPGEDQSVPYGALKEAHRICLRLAAQGFSSKEIAAQLGGNLHYRTIDQRLNRARYLINAFDRATAARAFARFEARHPLIYDDVIYDLPQVAEDLDRGERVSSQLSRVMEMAASPIHLKPSRSSWLAVFNPFKGRMPDDLPPLDRIAVILRLSVQLPMALGALSVGLSLLLTALRNWLFN